MRLSLLLEMDQSPSKEVEATLLELSDYEVKITKSSSGWKLSSGGKVPDNVVKALIRDGWVMEHQNRLVLTDKGKRWLDPDDGLSWDKLGPGWVRD